MSTAMSLPLTRRHFLALGTGAAAAFTLGSSKPLQAESRSRLLTNHDLDLAARTAFRDRWWNYGGPPLYAPPADDEVFTIVLNWHKAQVGFLEHLTVLVNERFAALECSPFARTSERVESSFIVPVDALRAGQNLRVREGLLTAVSTVALRTYGPQSRLTIRSQALRHQRSQLFSVSSTPMCDQ